MTAWQIRPFQPEDQPAVRRLILDGLGEHFGVVDETRNPDVDDIAGHYTERGHVFLVAVHGEEIIGSAALVCEDAQTGQLVRVSVARAWRRRGLARSLIQQLIAVARACGLKRLWMETNDDWEAAIGLYASCGFVEYDRREGNVYMTRAVA